MPHAAADDRRLELLRAIAAAEPEPWRPGEFAKRTGADRDSLDDPLNELRVGGFVRLDEWRAGVGQGYFLTPDGRRALDRPQRLDDSRPAPEPERPTDDSPVDPTPFSRLAIAAQIGVFAVGLLQIGELNIPLGKYLEVETCPWQAALGVSMAKLAAGKWWTVLSYALVHVGALHLFMNVVGFQFDATLSERMWGRLRFVVLLLVSVLGGAVGAVLSAPNGLTCGSSGGWCGLVAAQTVWIVSRRLPRHERGEWMRHFARVAILTVLISAVPGVSWGGHLGGAIAGGCTAGFLLLTNAQWPAIRLTGWCGIGVLVLALIAPLVTARF